ncbi:MAG: hypothetical protein WC951_07575 [Bacteroidales bacterium]|nr:hypothetical protein [Tenuifilaceae bacterium]
MKRFLVLLCLISVSAATFAERYVSRPDDIKTFLGTTTYVVLEDNPMSDYNFKIKEAVERSWKITPYEFISATQFEEMRSDISKSFLVKLQIKFTGDKLEATYNFLSVVLGAAVKKHTDLPDICSLPLGYNSVGEENYAFKVEALIKVAQKHIKNLDANPKLIKKNIFKPYNNNRKLVKNKELWILERDLDKSVRSLTDVRKNYPHSVKIVTPEDIENAVKEKNDNVVFLHKVGPDGTRLQARCYKLLIGAGDGELYYYTYHMINKKQGDGFLIKDFKKIK